MGRGKDVCYFDGLCGMCRRTTRMLRAVDWFHRLEFVDMFNVPAGMPPVPVPIEAAMTGMPMLTGEGRVLVGFEAVRRAMAQTVFAPAAWVLYIPGISAIGGAAYRWIAARRRRQCEIDPRGRGRRTPPASPPPAVPPGAAYRAVAL